MAEIELVRLYHPNATTEPAWSLGPSSCVRSTPAAVAAAFSASSSDAIFCLDEDLPVPDQQFLKALLDSPSDAWHGGLRLGTAGALEPLDSVNPQWTLGLAAPSDLESTSWELSLRALLVRREVIEQLGGPDPSMDTLTGAGLELGLRWIQAGALLRNVPLLVREGAEPSPPPPARDQFRAIARHHGRLWAGWALHRSVVQRRVPARALPGLVRSIRKTDVVSAPHYRSPARPAGDTTRTVSIIVPTIDRYAYVEPLLHQLAAQTVAPHEIIIVDQTPRSRRRSDLAAIEPDLPVTVFDLDEPGQSTARNLALERSTGEMVLFIDDDDEVGPALLAGHLALLTDGIDAICGGVDDATAGPPPPGFRHRRASDVFPTNNTMLRRAALAGSGLFDPVFDRGPRADRDLGVRLHLSGALVVYDPSVMVFHHHAPMGGLRTHGARKVTRASSRRSLVERNLPAVTELYCDLRYLPGRRVREISAINVVSTLTGEGSVGRRMARALVQLALLPDTVSKLRSGRHAAEQLVANRGALPALTSGGTTAAAL